jgi:ATP-dependent DNA helicase RecG
MKHQPTLDSPVQYLKSVGPSRALLLEKLGVTTARDLLNHYPRRYFDRSTAEPIGRLQVGREATVLGEILTCGQRRTRQGGSVQTVTVADATGVVFCIWFNQAFVMKSLRSGQRVMVSGLVQVHGGRRQFAHPDFEVLEDDREQLHTGRLVPVYPLTAGIGQHWLRRLIHQTLTDLGGEVRDPLPPELIGRRALCSLADALRGIHFPADVAQVERARRRLVYDELLAIQLVMSLRRGFQAAQPGVALGKPGDLTARLVGSLPFALTGAQRRVLAEILADLRRGQAMRRLLQGDVGAGKTLVALIAALFVIEQGYQAILMAPTEVLAQQHGQTLGRLCAPLGVSTELLTGSVPAAERRRRLRAATQGEVDLLIGTHALIQDDVQLPRLALAVVDEQHRFGVRQRARSLRGGGDLTPHLLVMSATPIPRSLALTLYGDLDLSILDEKPAGRLPVRTEVVAAAGTARVHATCREHVAAGRQGFVIYPVVEETAGSDIKAAVDEAARLAAGPFHDARVGLVHGRLKAREKESVMAAFSAGELDVLVATTVVEVGVDVPRAAWMVIHHPERFGLAQLHQLRGRIGRGGGEAWCWLVTGDQVGAASWQRLSFFAAQDDGFALAEEDLRLRGPGDLWGVRQHGVPGFRLANPLRDGELARDCAADARGLLAADPALRDPAHRPLRDSLEGAFGQVLPLAASG